MVTSSISRGCKLPSMYRGLGVDATNRDHQGWRRDRDAPSPARAEHTDRAHADGSAETFEPIGFDITARHRRDRIGRGIVRNAPIAPLPTGVTALPGPDLRQLRNTLAIRGTISVVTSRSLARFLNLDLGINVDLGEQDDSVAPAIRVHDAVL